MTTKTIETTIEPNGYDGLPSFRELTTISREIRNTARNLTDEEARFLTDAYYQVQDFRIAASHQIRSIRRNHDKGDVQVPFLDWSLDAFEYIENTLKSGLDRYSDAHLIGRWQKSIAGVGPVIAAGFMGHLGGRERKTVGEIWAFAGLDPTRTWGKGQKIPWNRSLKTLCWKLGESFVKQQNRENDIYGHIYAQRKLREWRMNLAGDYADQAIARVGDKRWEASGKNLQARLWWRGHYVPKEPFTFEHFAAGSQLDLVEDVGEGNGQPMLPPIAIQERSKRVAVKIFLSHWFHVWYEIEHGRPPDHHPYAIDILGHSGYMPPPNWPMD